MVGFAHLKRQSSYVSFSNDIILVNIFGRYTIIYEVYCVSLQQILNIITYIL